MFKRPPAKTVEESRALCPGCANDRFTVVGYESVLVRGETGVRLVPTRAVVSCYSCNTEYSVRLDTPGAELVENKREQKVKIDEDDRSERMADLRQQMQQELDSLMGRGPDEVARARMRADVRMSNGS